MSHTHPEQTKEVIDEEDNTIRCIHCKSEIVGKPWISVACGKDDVVHACNYICSNRLRFYIGIGYWDRVLNKEDFPGPRPVINTAPRRDITVNFGIEEIRREIQEEEDRIDMLEDYESDDSSNYSMSP
jgi:hypothetical protein